MGALAAIAPAPEDEVVGHAGVLGIVIAKRLQRRLAGDPLRLRADADQDVDDGLGAQARNGGGAVVFDRHHQVAQRSQDALLFGRIGGRPARIVVDEQVQAVLEAKRGAAMRRGGCICPLAQDGRTVAHVQLAGQFHVGRKAKLDQLFA